MGLQNKLLKAYIQGCNDTWHLVESAVKDIPGIGPKTHAKMMDSIREMAKKEIGAIDNLRPSERKKLDNAIDDMNKK